MKKSVLVFVLAFVPFMLSAEFNSARFPDSAEIRRTIVTSWFECPTASLRDKKEFFAENDIGFEFQVRMEEKDGSYALIVAPRSELDVDMDNNGVHKRMRAAVYPEGAQGSWILFRNKKTGAAEKVRWHFNPDADVYIEIRPYGNKSWVDMIVCGSYAARSVPLGVPFKKIYSASFDEVKRWTQKSLPWEKVAVVPGQYQDTLQMVGVMRENLDTMKYEEDACYDEHGVLKSVVTGNDFTYTDEEGKSYYPDISKCHLLSGAGFIKWIVDGIVEPATGRGTKIQDLTEPTVNISAIGKTGILSQKWNMLFTLDWCRNLAVAALDASSRRHVTFENSGVDVNRNYFVADIQNGELVNSTGYLSNTGYSTEKLKSVLYVLASTEPSWFYLAAVRQGSSVKHDELVFNNCAVLFPYFDDTGKFGCIVFDQGKELTLSEFMGNYPASFSHLERVKATEIFFPYSKK